MMVDFQPGYVTLWNNVRDLISPPKLPPLKVTSKPVAVRPLYGPGRKFQPRARNLHRRACSLGVVDFGAPGASHRANHAFAAKTEVNYVDVSPFLEKLPAGKTKAGGGGGGGERLPQPASRGKLPRWSMTQITPPMVVPRNLQPKLVAGADAARPSGPEGSEPE